jgi:alkylation response protein AidB-like acyl-CoA dehydrogenase
VALIPQAAVAGRPLDARSAFALEASQLDIRFAVRRFVADHLPIRGTRHAMETCGELDRAQWVAIATQLGLQGLAIPERFGGSGASAVELAVVAEELGAQLAAGAFLGTTLATALLLEQGDEDACREWLPRVADGNVVASVAMAEGQSWSVDSTATRASRCVDRWEVSGAKTFVLDGASADLMLVSARDDTGQLGVFLVTPGGSGVRIAAANPLDLTRRFAHVWFERAPARRIGGVAAHSLSHIVDLAGMLIAAESVGAAQRCLDMSVDHARNRIQFGRPIGSFQAIKHLCADMLVGVEFARSAARYAAWAAAERAAEFEVAAPLAKAQCTEAFYRVAASTIQIHGGIGFTWEHDAHLYFKRATASLALFGSAREHRARLAAQIGL